jgi:BCD family chlorophyll transporter-like MFS transporter
VLLRSFDYIKLIKIIQGAALCTMVLNLVALWKQEARGSAPAEEEETLSFTESFKSFLLGGSASRLLVAVGLGCAGFNMQDILLEPYGGELLHLSVSATTGLTALMAAGTLAGLFYAARWLSRGRDPYKLAAFGALIGVVGFTAVAFAAPCHSVRMFCVGIVFIGFGGGWFSVGTLTASMSLSAQGHSGVAIGAWGSVQATVAGAGIAFGGATRDVLSALAVRGALGPGLTSPAVGYCFVYVLEIALLFGTLVVIGPLVSSDEKRRLIPTRFGLAELPS